MAVGADGVIVETHPFPGQAKSDGPQALSTQELDHLGQELGLPQASSSIKSTSDSKSSSLEKLKNQDLQAPYDLVNGESITLNSSPIPSSL